MDVGLRKIFWVEAATTTNYLTNISPSLVLVDNKLEGHWSEEKPFISHLKDLWV
jgi:hypothetical protein